MSSRSVMQHSLDYLSKKLHLASLPLNERDECYLKFDDEFHVKCSFNEKKDECVLYSIIGRVPKYSLNAYTEILAQNFFWIGTAGSTLCLEPIDDEFDDDLILCQHIPMSIIDDQHLYNCVEDFVNAVEYWTSEYLKLNFEQQNVQHGNISNMESKVGNKECNIM